MSGTHERARLLALARAAEPPPLAGTDARRLLRRALLAGGARRQRRAERRGWLLSAAGGLALLGALALLHAWRAAGPLANHAGTARSEPPLELRLPAGDRLLATPGARFDLLRTTQQQREISLRGGTLAFEVVALAGDEPSRSSPHTCARRCAARCSRSRSTRSEPGYVSTKARSPSARPPAASACCTQASATRATAMRRRRIRCSPRRARWPNSVAGLLQQRRRKPRPRPRALTNLARSRLRERPLHPQRRSAWSRRAPSCTVASPNAHLPQHAWLMRAARRRAAPGCCS